MKKSFRVFLIVLITNVLWFSGIVRADSKNEGIRTAEPDNSYYANVDFDKIITYIHEHPESELALHYGRAYIDIDGILVIRLTCQDDKCKTFWEENLLSIPCKYVYSENSFLPLEELYFEIAEKISNLNTKVANNEELSEEEMLLSKKYPALNFDERANTLTVLFSEDANTENLPQEAYLSQCHQLFETVIGQSDFIDFKLVSQSDLLFDSYSSEYFIKYSSIASDFGPTTY